MERILLVEDDDAIIRMLIGFLKEEGFSVSSATGQSEAIRKVQEQMPDLALVDIALKEGNGFAVCSWAKEHQVPVIFLTASGDEYSVVTGLDMGADDYVAKPFRPRELVSRIRSVLRRTGKKQSIVTMGDLVIDTEKASVTKNGEAVYLSALEYKLLLVFLSNRGKVLTRERLLEEIWDCTEDYVGDNTLSVFIGRLRKKIETDPQNPKYIRTVRGLGYQMDGEGSWQNM